MSPSHRRRAVLEALKAKPMTLRELGAHVGLDHTTLNALLWDLEMQGIVARDECGDWNAKAMLAHAKASKFIWRLVA